MVDRFYDSDNSVDLVEGVAVRDAANGPSGQYVGGDIPGVEAKLPYLSDLGVTAIWLSAPYENRDYAGGAIDTGTDGNTYSAYHGYWPKPLNTDYSDPDNPSPRPLVETELVQMHHSGHLWMPLTGLKAPLATASRFSLTTS